MIPLIKPDLDFDEVAGDIRRVFESGQLTGGPFVREFEAEFSSYVGTAHALSTTSATTALHIALVARGIGPGDEVLVSDFTFPASGNVIVQAGATPVLVDCRPGGFGLDWDDARRKVTGSTRALMAVHPFGQPLDQVQLQRFRTDTGLWVLEDAACAIASRGESASCGALGDAAAFSFHPRKILTTGEGGMVTTNDPALFERLSVLRAHGGRPQSVGLEFVEIGFNYRMSEIQAVMGLAQLRRIDAIVEERRRVGRLYLEELADLDHLTVPLSAPAERCSFQSLVVLLDDCLDRNAIVAAMRDRGFETTLGTYAMHAHPSFARFGYAPGALPHSFRAQSSSLTLPLIKGMSAEDVRRVVHCLAAVCESQHRVAAARVATR